MKVDPQPFRLGDVGGSGPAVLCLHGLAGTPYEVRHPAEALAVRGFACVGPLLPGHGTDPEDLAATHRSAWLEAAVRAWDELASTHQRVYIMGLSMGGVLALALSARRDVQNGEAVVMRLLDQSDGIQNLDQLGMPTSMLGRVRELIHRPYGLLLVTGPTGSGKTTTLYAALRELNEPGKKIITVEDPVEYRLERINQVQVNKKVNLTFARVLRSSLRQDPDIIMIGEMRDQETAETGLRAAMTGHLVLSTLHTNDAISTPLRLIDMGAEGYLAASALRAVIAQRLVRKICESCCEPHDLDSRERAWISAMEGRPCEDVQLYRGSGCSACNDTGGRGRVGGYELLEIDESLANALREGDQGMYGRVARSKPESRPLALSALDYARERITTIQEVFRLAEEIEDAPAVEPGAATAAEVAADGSDAPPSEEEPIELADVIEGGVEAYIGE